MTPYEYFKSRFGKEPKRDADKLMCLMMLEYAIEVAEKAVDDLGMEQPYKKSGDVESYSPYREGFNDALDSVPSRIKQQTGGN